MRVQTAAARETARQRIATRRDVPFGPIDSIPSRNESQIRVFCWNYVASYRETSSLRLAFGYTSAKIYFDERNRARPTSIVAQIVDESEAGIWSVRNGNEKNRTNDLGAEG